MTTPTNSNRQNQRPYVAYLVRLWQETPNGPWRASAQSVQTGEITRFGSQQALFAFLNDETDGRKEQTDT